MNEQQIAQRIAQPPIFYSIEGIRRDCQREFNSHWFDADSMRFFNSRVSSNVYATAKPNLWLFVSSERFDWSGRHPRLYSIRVYNSFTGNIDTIGEFQQYESYSAAHYHAARIAPDYEGEA